MSKNRKFWKKHARKSLSGHWFYAIGGCVVVEGIALLGNMLAGRLFSGNTTLSLVLSGLFIFVYSIVTMIFSTGCKVMYLNMARDRNVSFGDILSMFHHETDGVLTAGFIISLIETVVQLPAYYMLYFADQGTTAAQQWIWIKTCIGFMLVGIVLAALFTIPFKLTFYLLADTPEMGGMGAVRKSMGLMKGNMLKYIGLLLSFLPFMILSVFTFYLALLWVVPYLDMCTAVFYMDAVGEFEGEPGGPEQEKEEAAGNGDDYNSEA